MTYAQMACHTWALAANPMTAALTNTQFVQLCDRLGSHYGYGTNLRRKPLNEVRQNVMEEIAKLAEPRTQLLNNVVYLCGGFRSGQVCPEHLWLEDHTAWKTYDTFIDQKIAIVPRAGTRNSPFRPGCEADEFAANEISRVNIMGFTNAQIHSISTYSEIRN
jgi:hypothetical protein